MRKILSLVVIICQLMSFNAFAVDFTPGEPAGTTNASDLDYWISTVNNEALNLIQSNYRRGAVLVADTVSTLNVLAGEISCTDGSGNYVWRQNTSTTAVTWSDIDAGSEANSTQYYVYAVGDASATTFTISISTNSSAPTGVTYYRKIGYFYNDSGGDIVSVGNVKEGDASNIVSVEGTSDISTTSTSYTDMTDMTIYFVSSGRPVRISFAGPLYNSANSTISTVADVDGTDYSLTFYDMDSNYRDQSYGETVKTLSSGAHTIKVQWKVSGGTGYQSGSSDSSRRLTIEEL